MLVAISFVQIRYLIRADTIARRSAIAARRSAIAARRAAEHIPRVERAYVWGGFGAYDGETGAVFSAVHNDGKTPCTVTHVAIACVGTRVGDSYSGGSIVSASPIISGLSKPAKLVHNPEPFGYYYKAFIDSVLESERLLVIGYGARDDHINVWLHQYTKVHKDNRKVVWICKLPGRSVGEMTTEKQMIKSLAGPGGFRENRDYDDPNSPRKFQQCGALGLVPSGFPVSPEIEAEIFRFLR